VGEKVAVIAGLAAALLLAGCSQGTSGPEVASVHSPSRESAGATGDRAASAVERYLDAQRKLVECFRENGLPDTKDPDELGTFEIGVGDPDVEDALTACREIGLAARNVPPEIQEQIREREAARMTPQQKEFEADLARCMHESGVPEWPDPLPDGTRGIPAWEKPGSITPEPAGLGRALELCNDQLGNGPAS